MLNLSEQRIINEALYIVENNATVRSCAAAFGVGKSTVHTDVTVKLKRMDPGLYMQVGKVLSVNLSERHLRGGNSTRLLYKKKKNPCSTDTGR